MPCKKSSRKKYKERRSPAFPANDPECRGKTKTRYGKRWKSIPNKNGLYRWIPLGRSRLDLRSLKVKVRSRSIDKVKGEKKEKGKRVIHCEPYTWSPNNPWIGKDKGILVTSKLYAAMKRKPGIYRGKRSEYGNAYRFGPRLPLSAYTKIGGHRNDGAQTGLIDPSSFQGDDKMLIGNVYEKHGWEWEDRKALNKIQKTYPGVLFIGETDGGDVGADLYGHKNKAGLVDSIIIDNDYFFPHKDE